MTDLIPSADIYAFLAKRDEVLAVIENSLDVLEEATEFADNSSCGSIRFAKYFARYGSNTDWKEELKERIRVDFDASCWETLMHRSGMWSFLDMKRRFEWSRSIENRETPPFEHDAVMATFADIYENRLKMLDEGFLTMWQSLSWDHKTNSPTHFGKRFIVKFFRDYRGYSNEYAKNKLDDLLRVMRRFDGKPEHDYRNTKYFLGCGGVWEEYFTIKEFKNGNAHITFNADKMDIVEKLNFKISQMCPGALPAPRKYK